jgi:signal transduction histidine kinase/CheY-like chemotaxis protein
MTLRQEKESKRSKIIKNEESPPNRSISLPILLVIPFVLQIFVAVAITGYLSFRNGEKAVQNLAKKLQTEVSNRVDLHLDHYLNTAVAINQINADAVRLGLLNLRDYQKSALYQWKQLKVFNNIGYISYALPTGEYSGAGRWLEEKDSLTLDEISANTNWESHIYLTDDQGNRLKRVDDNIPYHPLTESWYTETVKQGKPTWTEVYAWDDFDDILSLPVNYPIYDQNNQLLAVLSVDLLLKGIQDFLLSFQISPSAKVFIIERNGLLIASSSSEKPYKIINNEAQRLNVFDSQDKLINATANYLKTEFNNFQHIQQVQQLDFKINGVRHFAQVTPWKDELGLDWLVVVTLPESDFMAEIYAHNRITILLCLTSLIVATGLGILTSAWITRPIRRLSLASSAIARGNLEQTVKVKGVNELRVLANSFNQMARQLRYSFVQLDFTNKKLEKINQELEQRVAERTQELQISKEKAEKAQYKAEIASQAKSNFLANMSHELRTPLNAILGFTQIMEREQTTTDSQLEYLTIIHRSGEHLLGLINDVLDMSKIEAGHIDFAPNSFNLYQLLENTKQMLDLKAQSKNLQLLWELHPETPQYIHTDERKLKQVLINLLTNAIKFTNQGRIILRVKADNEDCNNLLFEIEDTGIGIAPEDLDIIFEAFTQTESSKISIEGTGLGLAISRKFVQLMGGDILVTSKLGVGTVFQFNIVVDPPLLEEVETTHNRQRVIGLEANQPSYRILIVDDRQENRQIMFKLLEMIGFEVKEAINGKEAIEIWEQWQPHLIWMDMRMPVMNGYEATKYIKSHLKKGQVTYIIALTASTFESEKANVLAAGCDDFVRKPFQEEIIFDKMAKYLGVCYIYEETNQPNLINVMLEPAILGFMPREWLIQLEQTASEADEEAILELIGQIPDEYHSLQTILKKKVNNFDFDEIVNLVQKISKIDDK